MPPSDTVAPQRRALRDSPAGEPPGREEVSAHAAAAASRRARLVPYGLLAPAAAVLGLLVGYPLVRLAVISVRDYGLRALFTGRAGWAGLANYRAVLDDPQLVPVLVRSAAFCAALVAGTLVIGLGTAVMLRGLGRVARTAVTLTLIASWAMPNVAATLVWQWLFQPGYGVVNWCLTQLGWFGDLTQHDWTAHALTAFAMVWLLVVWQSVPFVALTLYAGLTQIPRAYYEAASLDGAGAWRSFLVITVPFLRPVLGLVTVLSVIWDFNVFNQLWILTQGGPGGSTTTLGVWSFTKAFSANSFGQGAAIAVFSVAVLAVLTAVHVRGLVRAGEEW